LAAQIHKALNVNLPLAEIFKRQTIRLQARFIKESKHTGHTPVEPVEEKEYYELSYNQKRLWLIHQLEPDSTAYHLPMVMPVGQEMEETALSSILSGFIERHESFRTCFITVDNQPVQRVKKAGDMKLPLEIIDISTLEKEEQEKRAAQVYGETNTIPFDLGRAPLFRAVLLKVSQDMSHLMFNMHHIISDGWSMELLKKEFFIFYDACIKGKPAGLRPLNLQYRDFAAWQERQLRDPRMKEEAHRYWKETVLSGLPGFTLPRDDNPSYTASEGAHYRVVLPVDVKDNLYKQAHTHGVSLFAVVFAAANMLLSWLSGARETVCGITAAGREHADLEAIVGFFVNTLIFRCTIDYEETFTDFLRQVSARSLDAQRHQGYPLELVLDDLKMKFPPIPVMFNMLNAADTGNLEAGNIDEWEYNGNAGDVKCDVSFYVTEYKDGIEIRCHYRKRSFERARMEDLVRRYLQLLHSAAADPGKKIKEYFPGRKHRRLNLVPGDNGVPVRN
jgi:hypothetical protein